MTEPVAVSLDGRVMEAERKLEAIQRKAAKDATDNARAIHDAIRAVVAAKVAAGDVA